MGRYKWLMLVLLIGLAFSLPARAAVILLVSDAYAPGDPAGTHEDDVLVSWLQGLGHTVDTYGMGQTMQGAFDPADDAAIAASDLIMVSRRTNSGAYNQPLQWNAIQKPLILMSGYLSRSSRWGWSSGGSGNVAAAETDMAVSAGMGGHVFLNEVHALADPVGLFDWSTAPTPGQTPKGIYIPPVGDVVAAADMVGTMDPATVRAMLYDIPAGTDLGVTFGVTADKRAFLGHWGYDIDLGAPINRRAQWDDFITQDYKDLLENMIVVNTASPVETQTWDENHVVLDWGSAHWLPGPTTLVPTNNALLAATNTDIVAVGTAGGQANNLTVEGGGISISGELEIAARVSFDSPAVPSLTMGAGTQLTTGMGGSIDNMVTAGDATVSTGGVLTVDGFGMAAGSTFTKAGDGRMTVPAAGVIAAAGTIELDGGTFALDGDVNLHNNVLAGLFYNVATGQPDTIEPIDDGVGVMTGLPNWEKALAEPLAFGNNTMQAYAGVPENDYVGAWAGKLTVGGANLPAGIVSFGMRSDDGNVLYIDLNHDGNFSDGLGSVDVGELIVADNVNHGFQNVFGTVNLAAGTYDFVTAFYERGGGDGHFAKIGVGALVDYDDPGMMLINPADPAQDGVWSAQTLGPIDAGDTDVVLKSSTTLQANTSFQATFGGLTLVDGILATDGALGGVVFQNGTDIDAAAAGGTVGFDPQVATDVGVIRGHSIDATLAKDGSGDMVLDKANQGLENVTIEARGGTLAMVGQAPWGGAHSALLSGGMLRVDATPGTLSYWSFDDDADLGHDDSGQGHDLSVVSALANNFGKFAGAIEFTGNPAVQDGSAVSYAIDDDSEDYINGLSEITIAMWVQANAIDVDRGIWEARDSGGGDVWGVRYDTVGASAGGDDVMKVGLTFDTSGGNPNRGADQQESSEGVQTTLWQHVAITWASGEGFKMYIDGVLDASPTSAMATTVGRTAMADRFTIGDGSKAGWDGLVDEAYIVNYALSPDEIVEMGDNDFAVVAPELPDLSGVDVTVSAPSTLSVANLGTGEFAFGPLTMKDGGILTTEGAPMSFNGLAKDPDTTVDPAAAAVGFDPQTDTDIGLLDGSNAGATITKYGGGTLVLDEANINLLGSTFQTQAGQLNTVPADVGGGKVDANPLGPAGLLLNGGELVLSGRQTGDAPFYDNAVEVIANSTLTAGPGAAGAPGPVDATLGSTDKASPMTLTSGTLSVQAVDSYTLTVDGDISGPGGINAVAGPVTLAQEVDIGSLDLTGGDLTLSNGATVGDLGASSGTLTTGGYLNVTTGDVTGTTFSGLQQGENNMVVSESLNIGGTDYAIDAGNTFAANGSQFLAEANLTVSGGVLTAGSGGTSGPLDILFVVGNPDLSIGGDQAVYDRLTIDLGHTVTPQDDNGSDPTQATDMDLVIVSSTIGSGNVTTKFTDQDATFAPMEIPTINWEQALSDDYHWSDSGAEVADQDTITIVDDTHFLAAGLAAGDHLVYNATNDMSFANVGNNRAPGAEVIAERVGNPDHAAILVVEAGGELNNNTFASARRLHIFLEDQGLNPATAACTDLFDAAVAYAVGADAVGGLDQETTHLFVSADVSPTSEIRLASGEDAILGNLTVAEGVTEVTISDGAFSFQDVTTPENTTINGLMSVRGNLNIGGSPGLLTVSASGGAFEFGEDAVYNVEIAEWDSPGGLPPQPPLPVPPLDATINDRLHASAGDVYLDGSLTLNAITKLHSRVPHPDPPNVEVEWYGDQTRVIVSSVGEAVVGWTFANVPDPQPVTWDNLLTGTPEWSQGHIGRGVFLTRQNDGGENDVPGISYGINTTKLHLFQAADGDTNGDRTLGGRDIQNIQSFALFGIPEDPGPGFVWPPDWSQGDFDGDGLVTGLDISAILATGLWPSTYAAIDPGTPLDGVVDLLLYPEDVTLEDGTVVPAGTVMIDPDGLTLNGYVLRSAEGIFTGAPAQQLNWFFVEDTDRQISGNMGATIVQVQDLGPVVGPEWTIINPFEKQDVNPFDDLTLTYTVAGTPGTFVGNLIIVPEPSTIVMLLGVVLGLAVLALRKRRG